MDLSFTEEWRLCLSLILYLISCISFCGALNVSRFTAALAVGAFTLAGPAFCIRMVVRVEGEFSKSDRVTHWTWSRLNSETIGEAMIYKSYLAACETPFQEVEDEGNVSEEINIQRLTKEFTHRYNLFEWYSWVAYYTNRHFTVQIDIS